MRIAFIDMANFSILALATHLIFGGVVEATKLQVSGKNFVYGGQKVFLSGTNFAWKSYGYDFGNGNYAGSGPTMEQWLKEVSAAGGNTVRVWLHVEGDSTPQFGSNGLVTSPDAGGKLISDLSKFLDVAQSNNIFVILVLWNGAVMRNQNMKNLILDDNKLNSYINNALRPIVRALKNKPALGAWEVMNEPEGSVFVSSDSNPCYDTTKIGQAGAGWTKNNVPMQRFLRFINWQNAAIKEEDPTTLTTIGSWSYYSQNGAFSDSFNHYADSCLVQAGGKQKGTIDFHQIHAYSWQQKWQAHAPFVITAADYKLTKPLVVGEFASTCAQNEGVNPLWDYAYNKGYAGAWAWQYNAGGECTDTQAAQKQGMSHIKGYTGLGRVSGLKIK